MLFHTTMRLITLSAIWWPNLISGLDSPTTFPISLQTADSPQKVNKLQSYLMPNRLLLICASTPGRTRYWYWYFLSIYSWHIFWFRISLIIIHSTVNAWSTVFDRGSTAKVLMGEKIHFLPTFYSPRFQILWTVSSFWELSLVWK